MADVAGYVIKGVITRLLATTGLTAIVGQRVYSAVPQQATFPFVMVSVSSEPYDMKDSTGQMHRVRVQGFSRSEAVLEALNIRKYVYDALHRQEGSISVINSSVIRSDYSGFADCFLEDDGATHQSIIEFEIVTQ